MFFISVQSGVFLAPLPDDLLLQTAALEMFVSTTMTLTTMCNFLYIVLRVDSGERGRCVTCDKQGFGMHLSH